MALLRSRDELEALKSDLHALRSDLRDIARDVGSLTSDAARNWRQTSARDWVDWVRARIGDREDLEQSWSAMRERGEKSATAIRATVQDHPAAAVAGALAVGLALAWFLSRSYRR
jgi:ElaB/YqjD/DUF883 family membrane-anchored ribosome-binding protein